MNRKISTYIWGLFILIFGILMLLKTLDLITFNIFFKGWWTLFIIIPSAIDILVNDHKISSFNFLLIGVLLLLNSQRIIDNPVMIFICLMIIELGLKLLFGKKYKKIKNKNCDSYIGIFGESNSLNNDPNFQGCDIVTVFGTVKLDLSEIDFKNDVKIDAVNVFGTIYLTIPDDIEVNFSGINIFSSNHNKKKIDNPKHTIFIENVSVFGDIKIK